MPSVPRLASGPDSRRHPRGGLPAAREGRIAKLEAELGNNRKPGDITRAHSASGGDGAPKNGNGDSPPGASLEDSFRNFARSKGVSG